MVSNDVSFEMFQNTVVAEHVFAIGEDIGGCQFSILIIKLVLVAYGTVSWLQIYLIQYQQRLLIARLIWHHKIQLIRVYNRINKL